MANDEPELIETVEGVDPAEIEKDRIRRQVVLVDIDYIEASTDRACLVVVGMLKHWIPRSQIVGARGPTLAVTKWIAETKGLPHRPLGDFEITKLPTDDDIPF